MTVPAWQVRDRLVWSSLLERSAAELLALRSLEKPRAQEARFNAVMSSVGLRGCLFFGRTGLDYGRVFPADFYQGEGI